MANNDTFEDVIDGALFLGSIEGISVTEDRETGDALLVVVGEERTAISTIEDYDVVDGIGEAALQIDGRLRQGGETDA